LGQKAVLAVWKALGPRVRRGSGNKRVEGEVRYEVPVGLIEDGVRDLSLWPEPLLSELRVEQR